MPFEGKQTKGIRGQGEFLIREHMGSSARNRCILRFRAAIKIEILQVGVYERAEESII